jgi:4'-phosphopantetheinyl transferase
MTHKTADGATDGFGTWPACATTPALEAGEVHLWAASLEIGPDVHAALSELLAEDERARARRFVVGSARARFVASRGALRLLLGAYARLAPDALTIRVAEGGKPFLDGATWLRFNLAHSDGLALVAVARDVEVGVDVERRRVVSGLAELAARYFAPEEARALAVLPPDAQADMFLRCWTSKEAVLKVLGGGLALGLDSVRLTVAPAEPPRLLDVAGVPEAAAGWGLHALTPASDYLGALAVPAPACRLRCFTLRVEEPLAASMQAT